MFLHRHSFNLLKIERRTRKKRAKPGDFIALRSRFAPHPPSEPAPPAARLTRRIQLLRPAGPESLNSPLDRAETDGWRFERS